MNQKIENQLNLATSIPTEERLQSRFLSTGYNPVTNTWEVIIRYIGDIRPIQNVAIKVTPISEQYALAVVSEDRLNELANLPQIILVEKPKDMNFNDEVANRDSCITPVQEGANGLSGKGVLVGIIDSGIDYFHNDFRNEDGTTRIVSILDFEVPQGDDRTEIEYTQEQINLALEQPTREEGLLIVPVEDYVGHGTHVAGIAAGNGRSSDGRIRGVAYESPLIIVKLGRRGDEFAKTTEIMRGIQYILDKARQMQMPVAINISFGNNYGAHDGSSLLETFINEVSNQWKNVIAIGAGNEGAAGHHYQGEIAQGQTIEVGMDVADYEREVSVQLWKSFSDVYTIEIISPSGQTSGVIQPVLGTQNFQLGQTKINLFFGEPSPYQTDQEIYFVMIPANDYIDSGSWKIRISAQQVVIGRFNMWLPVSAGINIFTRFSNPQVNTTLTIPSTSARAITVGAYNPRTNSIASFSGRGFTRELNMVKPNIVAPGVDIMSTLPRGTYGPMSGTSMATPFVTGAAALLMEWGIVRGNDPFMYGEKVKATLQKGAKRDSFRSYPDPSWGYGALCLANALQVAASEIRTLDSKSLSKQESEEKIDKMQETLKAYQELELQLPTEGLTTRGVYTIGENCSYAITSEDHFDLIVEYTEGLTEIVQKFKPDCIQIIDGTYVILHVPFSCSNFSELDRLFPKGMIPFIVGPYGKSDLNASGILAVHEQPYVPLRGQGMLIGVIDSGIDYTHSAFRYEDGGTKILRIWDQSIQGNPPEGFFYGTEYTKEMIDEALFSDAPYQIVPHMDEYGHGTFLAGVAAGREVPEADFIGAAPDADLLVVKLKPAKHCLRELFMVNQDYNPVYQSTDIIMAVKYLDQVARELKRPLSIVIGLGSNQGGHDGSAYLEVYLRDIAQRVGRVVTVAAGNEANLGHHYYQFFSPGETTKTMEINVAKNENGFLLLIWTTIPDKVSISITSPTGEYIDRIPARIGQVEEVDLVLEESRIIVEYDMNEERTGDQVISVRIMRPTEGIWTITLYGDLIVDGRINAWLSREGFINPETAFLMPTAHTTVTFPSTGIGVITVGAYNHQNNSLYIGSGRGLTRDLELKPDLVAPGVNVIGPLPINRFGTMTGTSVSAATTAGAAALLLEWGIAYGNDRDMDTEKVRNYLIRGARRRANISYPNREWGYGELNLLGTFEALRGYRS